MLGKLLLFALAFCAPLIGRAQQNFAGQIEVFFAWNIDPQIGSPYSPPTIASFESGKKFVAWMPRGQIPEKLLGPITLESTFGPCDISFPAVGSIVLDDYIVYFSKRGYFCVPTYSIGALDSNEATAFYYRVLEAEVDLQP